MIILLLNDMRSANVENLRPVCWAETREQLDALLAHERVEPYNDGHWGKAFRRGGALEWFNPPSPPYNGLYGTVDESFIEVPETWRVDGCIEFRAPQAVDGFPHADKLKTFLVEAATGNEIEVVR